MLPGSWNGSLRKLTGPGLDPGTYKQSKQTNEQNLSYFHYSVVNRKRAPIHIGALFAFSRQRSGVSFLFRGDVWLLDHVGNLP